MEQYDLIILGGGPAGYVAAIEAGKAGKQVLLFEAQQQGGVCLNAGCIPTKTLLYTAKNYAHMVSGDVKGLGAMSFNLDYSKALAWKDTVINTYRNGILQLFNKAGVRMVQARGRLLDRSTVEADGKVYKAHTIMITTGSRPAIPSIEGLKESRSVVTSTELLQLESIPKHLCVVGAGVIGLEFAALFSQLGSQVTVIEMLDHIAPMVEPEMRKALTQSLKKRITFHISAAVQKIDGDRVYFTKKGKELSIEADTILIAAGRKANIEDIGLKEAGVKTSKGFILVNERLETSAPRIYAFGDVVGTSLFAHSASRMAEIAVKVYSGDRTAAMKYNAIPWAIYTWPEVAGCGYTEAQADELGMKVVTATAQLRTSARYFAENGNTPGLVKLVAAQEDKKIIGFQMIGSNCSEMLWGASMAINLGLHAKDIVETVFAHPTISEVIREAALQLL